LRGRIAKLEAQLDGGELRSRPREQQIAVAHRMQSARSASMSAETYSRLSDLPDYVSSCGLRPRFFEFERKDVTT
jgi:hypothetical protein